jgi:phosphoglycolate phosphatase-like HAD superfamily hydrolase
MVKVDGIVFDLDGTLVKTIDWCYAVDGEVIFRLAGVRPNRKELHERYVRLGRSYENVYNSYGIKPADGFAMFMSIDETIDNVVPMDGAHNISLHLSTLKIPKHILTYNPSLPAAMRRVNSSKLCDYYGTDEITATGSHKGPALLEICRRYKISPRKTWLVTDSVIDIEAAKEVGVKTLAKLGDESNDTVAELLTAKPTDFCYNLDHIKKLLNGR